MEGIGLRNGRMEWGKRRDGMRRLKESDWGIECIGAVNGRDRLDEWKGRD
jgi:hypothetical protein